MSSIFKRGPAPVEANLTSMIDVTFLLIVFFVLVSQIVEVENVDLMLPALVEPATELPGDEQRAVINVVPGSRGRADSYRLSTRVFTPDDRGVAGLEHALAELLAANPALRINLRADQSTHYDAVEPVLRAVASAARRLPTPARPQVNLVIVREDG